MQETSLQLLNVITQKIDQISNEKANLKSELLGMQQYIEQLLQNIEAKEFELSKLNEELTSLRMAKPLENQIAPKEDLKTKVDEMIKEIDKCITLLTN